MRLGVRREICKGSESSWILLSSSSECEPPCESPASGLLQTRSYDGRGSQTTRKNNFERAKRGVFYTAADGSTAENEGERTFLMTTSDGAQMRKVTFQVANVNKALKWVSKMVRNGNRVVFDTSGSYNRGHDGGTARKATEE